MGLILTGVVAGLGATALAVLDDCDPAPANDCQERKRIGAALAMGIPAAALLLSGATVLTVGVVRGRGDASDRSQQSFGPGVVLHGRF